MRLAILGTRGVPAAHGGFETFAERLALYLVERGWSVRVYCQSEQDGASGRKLWRGIEQYFIRAGNGAIGTVGFDWKCAAHAASQKWPCLVLGYNTAVFAARLRALGVPIAMNMDGIEWKRAKWGVAARTWLRLNEWAGARIANLMIADHPEIATHLKRHRTHSPIVMIPYGASEPQSAEDDLEILDKFSVKPGGFYTLIARPEPENSPFELIRGHARARSEIPMIVLGRYHASNPYHKLVLGSASGNVKFVGAIYDQRVVNALRNHCFAYLHGHQVGGTNPSLVEALAAGNAVIAHDNRFNRWVAGDAAAYFSGEDSATECFLHIERSAGELGHMRNAASLRWRTEFQWPGVLASYEMTLSNLIASSTQTSPTIKREA
jgi:glycosyltransferase involved in cell wall biosynthesis